MISVAMEIVSNTTQAFVWRMVGNTSSAQSTTIHGPGCNCTEQTNYLDPLPRDDFQSTTWVLVCVEALLTLLILTENGLVIVAFLRSKYLKQAIANYYIFQMTLSDFILGLCMVVHVLLLVNPHLLQNQYVCVMRYSMLMTAGGMSSLSVLATTYDRFLAVADPLHYRSTVSKSRVLLQVVVIDAVPLGLCFLVPFAWNNTMTEELGCDLISVFKVEYLAFILIPVFLVAMVTKVVLYAVIFYLAKKRMQNAGLLHPCNTSKHHNIYKSHMALTKTGAIVVATYITCWLPFFVSLMLQVYGKVESPLFGVINLATFLLIALHSALNPVVYVWRTPTFRTAMKDLLLCRKSEDLSRRSSFASLQESRRRSSAFSSSVITHDYRDSPAKDGIGRTLRKTSHDYRHLKRGSWDAYGPRSRSASDTQVTLSKLHRFTDLHYTKVQMVPSSHDQSGSDISDSKNESDFSLNSRVTHCDPPRQKMLKKVSISEEPCTAICI